jgi:SAM-dependent methyltransferase
MRPGPLIRGLFGPYEREIAEAYRTLFVDLDDFVDRLQVWAPQPRRMLEVGCGEGAMTERLSKAYPAATVTGTDITPKIGRLFRGDAAKVRFLRRPVEDVTLNEPASFDLVVLSRSSASRGSRCGTVETGASALFVIAIVGLDLSSAMVWLLADARCQSSGR